jgi:hypothetical protein
VEEKTMLWLELKNLHAEIDGAAARATASRLPAARPSLFTT